MQSISSSPRLTCGWDRRRGTAPPRLGGSIGRAFLSLKRLILRGRRAVEGPSRRAYCASRELIRAAMTDDEILAEFRDADALLEGHFILSSGLRSPRYLQ